MQLNILNRSDTLIVIVKEGVEKINLRTNGPVNAHLIAGPCISTQHTNPE